MKLKSAGTREGGEAVPGEGSGAEGSAHGPEPWRAKRGYVVNAEGRIVISAGAIGLDDARRVVACVNACAGLPTEALEAGALAKALDVLSDHASWAPEGGQCSDCGQHIVRWGEGHKADCAIANALRALRRLP